LATLTNEPILPTSKDYWEPSAAEIALLAAESSDVRRGYLERQMLNTQAMIQTQNNADIKTRNENKKKQRDEIILRSGDARKSTINTIIGITLADRSVDLCQRVLKWKGAIPTDPTDPLANLIADNMEEAYKEAWLFVFEQQWQHTYKWMQL
jgi:hypothetical protein